MGVRGFSYFRISSWFLRPLPNPLCDSCCHLGALHYWEKNQLTIIEIIGFSNTVEWQTSVVSFKNAGHLDRSKGAELDQNQAGRGQAFMGYGSRLRASDRA